MRLSPLRGGGSALRSDWHERRRRILTRTLPFLHFLALCRLRFFFFFFFAACAASGAVSSAAGAAGTPAASTAVASTMASSARQARRRAHIPCAIVPHVRGGAAR